MSDMMYKTMFREAMRAAGITPPNSIIDSGKIERFGKNLNCWYVYYSNGGIPAGAFGDWGSVDSTHIWRADTIGRYYTPEENLIINENIKKAKAQAEESLRIRHQKAAIRAEKIWVTAKSASPDHPYLKRKGIQPFHLRQSNSGRLIVPFFNISGQVQTLQFISEDGSKRFLAGGKKLASFSMLTHGRPIQSLQKIYIAEGFATAASIENAMRAPVIIAGDAGNLIHVAKVIKAKHPDVMITICGDNDEAGRKYANQAVKPVDGAAIFPPNDFNDFNDLDHAKGVESVRLALSGWSIPQEIAETGSADYPIDALPQEIREAVEEVRNFVQAPVALIATSAISSLSLATQAYIDVKRAEGLSGPCSLYTLVVADSGERKTTCDRYFMAPIIEWEKNQLAIAEPLIREYQAKYDAWVADYEGVKLKIKSQTKNGKSINELKEELENLKFIEPEEPRVPRLKYGDITPEELGFRLANKWPSAGLISNEAGSIFGSHALNKDNAMKSLSQFNQLWDGSDISADRRTTDSWSTDGARLTVSFQVQEEVLRSFFERTGSLVRGSGFLARFLLAWPVSTQGYRPFIEASHSWPKLTKFQCTITKILQMEVNIDPVTKGLRTKILSLSISAKKLWIDFYNHIESMLVMGGDLHEVRDVASKAADNAARIAGLFQFFVDPKTNEISDNAMQSAIRVAAWYLYESKRFFGELALAPELADTTKLDSWMLAYCKNNNVDRIERSYCLQHGPLRSKTKLDAAMMELLTRNRIRQEKVKGKIVILINPALL